MFFWGGIDPPDGRELFCTGPKKIYLVGIGFFAISYLTYGIALPGCFECYIWILTTYEHMLIISSGRGMEERRGRDTSGELTPCLRQLGGGMFMEEERFYCDSVELQRRKHGNYDTGVCQCGVKEKICRSPEGKGPGFCPTLHRAGPILQASEEYAKSEISKFAKEASIQEAECYINRNLKPYVLHPAKPRVQETCEFAQKMGYKRLGIAFCAGLHQEALSLTAYLRVSRL